MKKLIVVVLMLSMVQFAFAQKANVVKPETSDTVKLPLSKLNVETLVDLSKKRDRVASQLIPLQKQLNLIDSTWSSVLKTKLDAHGHDPEKGRYGIIGMNLVYVPSADTTKASKK